MLNIADGVTRFYDASGWHTGAVIDGTILALSGLSLRQLLAQDPTYIESALYTKGVGRRVDDVDLGPPVPDPEKIICLGHNYYDHAETIGGDRPPVPGLFAKFPPSLIGSGQPIILCPLSSQPDYEGELAVIISRPCRNVTEQDALSYVAGYTIMNDISARDLQLQTSQYMAGKMPDTYGPLGPVVVPPSRLKDPQALTLHTRLNGEVMQEATTAQMIFSVATTIAWLSSILTLSPGDIISTGTPSGIGHTRQPQVHLKPGDLIEVAISGIGTLSNTVRSQP
jgi:acylpyruvate hydrolase